MAGGCYYAPCDGSPKCYPHLGDGVSVVSSTSVWTYGGWTEVVPINTITKDFKIRCLNLFDISGNDEYQIQIGIGTAGNEVCMGDLSFERTSAVAQEGNQEFCCPKFSANSRVVARLATKSTTANSCKLKLHYLEVN